MSIQTLIRQDSGRIPIFVFSWLPSYQAENVPGTWDLRSTSSALSITMCSGSKSPTASVCRFDSCNFCHLLAGHGLLGSASGIRGNTKREWHHRKIRKKLSQKCRSKVNVSPTIQIKMTSFWSCDLSIGRGNCWNSTPRPAGQPRA